MKDEVAQMREIHALIRHVKGERLRRKYIRSFWRAFKQMEADDNPSVRTAIRINNSLDERVDPVD